MNTEYMGKIMRARKREAWYTALGIACFLVAGAFEMGALHPLLQVALFLSFVWCWTAVYYAYRSDI